MNLTALARELGGRRHPTSHPDPHPEVLLSIVHTFSCRLHGLRRYEKALKDELGGGGR